MAKTLNVRISDDIEQRLENLLDEYEEAYLALERISEKNAKYYTSKEVKKLLEL